MLLPRAILLLFCLTLIAGCGEKKPDVAARPDPREVYAQWVTAVNAGDGGKMFDMFDSTQKVLSMAMVQQRVSMMIADSSKKPLVAGFQGLGPREAFAKLISIDGGLEKSNVQGDYKILAVDTLYAVTVQHSGKMADLVVLKWENGAFKISAPPTRQDVALRVANEQRMNPEVPADAVPAAAPDSAKQK